MTRERGVHRTLVPDGADATALEARSHLVPDDVELLRHPQRVVELVCGADRHGRPLAVTVQGQPVDVVRLAFAQGNFASSASVSESLQSSTISATAFP